MPSTEEKPVPAEYGFRCGKCESPDVWFYVWEASDGGHEDYHYRCANCGRQWWVDGIDS